ncbi:hypothetical protein B0H13DRAFT_418341 [Mycena leptocephala]|nr:hypothetical protein B0H13DRAFT_418341 [Mycena leptocephala]
MLALRFGAPRQRGQECPCARDTLALDRVHGLVGPRALSRTYMKPYPRLFYAAARDEDGYIWLKGRIDHVTMCRAIGSPPPRSRARSACTRASRRMLVRSLPFPALPFDAYLTWGAASDRDGGRDEGQAVYVFVTLKLQSTYDTNNEAALAKELVLQVRNSIGPFAALKKCRICQRRGRGGSCAASCARSSPARTTSSATSALSRSPVSWTSLSRRSRRVRRARCAGALRDGRGRNRIFEYRRLYVS